MPGVGAVFAAEAEAAPVAAIQQGLHGPGPVLRVQAGLPFGQADAALGQAVAVAVGHGQDELQIACLHRPVPHPHLRGAQGPAQALLAGGEAVHGPVQGGDVLGDAVDAHHPLRHHHRMAADPQPAHLAVADDAEFLVGGFPRELPFESSQGGFPVRRMQVVGPAHGVRIQLGGGMTAETLGGAADEGETPLLRLQGPDDVVEGIQHLFQALLRPVAVLLGAAALPVGGGQGQGHGGEGGDQHLQLHLHQLGLDIGEGAGAQGGEDGGRQGRGGQGQGHQAQLAAEGDPDQGQQEQQAGVGKGFGGPFGEEPQAAEGGRHHRRHRQMAPAALVQAFPGLQPGQQQGGQQLGAGQVAHPPAAPGGQQLGRLQAAAQAQGTDAQAGADGAAQHGGAETQVQHVLGAAQARIELQGTPQQTIASPGAEGVAGAHEQAGEGSKAADEGAAQGGQQHCRPQPAAAQDEGGQGNAGGGPEGHEEAVAGSADGHGQLGHRQIGGKHQQQPREQGQAGSGEGSGGRGRQ